MLKKEDNEIKGESKSTHTLVPCLMTATHASKVSVYGLFCPSMKCNKFPYHVLSTRVFSFFSIYYPTFTLVLFSSPRQCFEQKCFKRLDAYFLHVFQSIHDIIPKVYVV